MGKLWDLLQRHIDGEKYPPSERQVAARLGVSPTTLGNWRDPKKLPSRENLQAIADLVGVRYSVVLEAALWDTGYHEAGEAQVVQIRKRPVTTIEADLRAKEADLQDWLTQELTGKDAESHERLLRSRVDALKAELVASRSALDETDSVAEL